MERKGLGALLYARRMALARSREHLARELEVATQTVLRWENSETMPQERYHQRLADFLGVSEAEVRALAQGEQEGVHGEG